MEPWGLEHCRISPTYRRPGSYVSPSALSTGGLIVTYICERMHRWSRLGPDRIRYRLLGSVVLCSGNIALRLVFGVCHIFDNVSWVRSSGVIVGVALRMFSGSRANDQLAQMSAPIFCEWRPVMAHCRNTVDKATGFLLHCFALVFLRSAGDGVLRRKYSSCRFLDSPGPGINQCRWRRREAVYSGGWIDDQDN
jgi:hypothetical protein